MSASLETQRSEDRTPMMHKAQKGMAKWTVRILLGLLILSFAMWGIADYVTGPVNPPVAHVGDREISSNEFLSEAQRRINAVRREQNQVIDQRTAIQSGLYAGTLTAMIDRNALLDTADGWNLGISDEAVAAEIRQNPLFQDFAGTTEYAYDRLIPDSQGLTALDTIDFWVGTFLILILAMLEIIAFSWVFGLEIGWDEIHHGAQIRIPAIFRFIMKWVAPIYLLVVLIAFCIQNLPASIQQIGQQPMAQLALAMLAVVGLVLMWCVRIGEKRWREMGLDLDGKEIDTDFAPAGGD